jgi:hypothetical protein
MPALHSRVLGDRIAAVVFGEQARSGSTNDEDVLANVEVLRMWFRTGRAAESADEIDRHSHVRAPQYHCVYIGVCRVTYKTTRALVETLSPVRINVPT